VRSEGTDVAVEAAGEGRAHDQRQAGRRSGAAHERHPVGRAPRAGAARGRAPAPLSGRGYTPVGGTRIRVTFPVASAREVHDAPRRPLQHPQPDPLRRPAVHPREARAVPGPEGPRARARQPAARRADPGRARDRLDAASGDPEVRRGTGSRAAAARSLRPGQSQPAGPLPQEAPPRGTRPRHATRRSTRRTTTPARPGGSKTRSSDATRSTTSG
jgi:hypothetical protein